MNKSKKITALIVAAMLSVMVFTGCTGTSSASDSGGYVISHGFHRMYGHELRVR